MNLLEYRTNAFIQILASVVFNLSMITFLKFLLAKISTVGGWDFYDMVLLYSVGQFWAYTYFFVTFSNTSMFWELILNGTLDMILVKPLDPIFMSTMKIVDWTSLVAMLQPIVMVIYVFSNKNYEVDAISVFFTAIFLLFAVAIAHLIEACVITVYFWTTNADVDKFTSRTAEITNYPYEIYTNKFFKILFMTLLPYGLIINLPFRILIHKVDYRLVVLEIFVLIGFYCLARLLWRAGLRNYQSASS